MTRVKTKKNTKLDVAEAVGGSQTLHDLVIYLEFGLYPQSNFNYKALRWRGAMIRFAF